MNTTEFATLMHNAFSDISEFRLKEDSGTNPVILIYSHKLTGKVFRVVIESDD